MDSPSNDIARCHNGGGFIIEPHQTSDEVAFMLGTDEETVKRYCSRGRWPHFRQPVHGGYRYMFCEHDVREISQKLEVSPSRRKAANHG